MLKALEQEKEKEKEVQPKGQEMSTLPSDYGTPHHLAPKSLFMTLQSSRQHNVYSTPQTPSLDNISDVDSLSVSSKQTLISSMTPDMSNLSLGRG